MLYWDFQKSTFLFMDHSFGLVIILNCINVCIYSVLFMYSLLYYLENEDLKINFKKSWQITFHKYNMDTEIKT